MTASESKSNVRASSIGAMVETKEDTSAVTEEEETEMAGVSRTRPMSADYIGAINGRTAGKITCITTTEVTPLEELAHSGEETTKDNSSSKALAKEMVVVGDTMVVPSK